MLMEGPKSARTAWLVRSARMVQRCAPRLQVRTLATDDLSAELLSRIPAADLADDIVFVADPFGNIMLYFTNAHDYRAQISDLKKLLKLSTIG